MSEVLFLAHRIPFPPDRGDKIRSCHVLRHIAALCPVHVACFADDEGDLAHEPELSAIAQSHRLVRRTRSLPVAGVEALLTGKPVSLTAFADKALHAYVAQVLAERPISAVYVFSGQMAQYVPASFAGRVVMDFVDVDSAKFDAYAAQARFPASWLYSREARLLSRFESLTARRATTSLLVTPEETELFRSRLSSGPVPSLNAVCNGINTGFFDPSGMPRAPELAGEGPHITFTGQMDYPPNVAAVEMFARDVMPLIRKTFAGASFHIVGRAPVQSVRALEGVNGTHVTGAVLDVRSWIAGADLIVAPLTIARGVQNKVLEAMAMARPVLATPEAATGIPARDGIEFVVAQGAEALARNALALLHDPVRSAAIGQSARAFVMRECGWDHVLAPLGAMLGIVGDEASSAAA